MMPSLDNNRTTYKELLPALRTRRHGLLGQAFLNII